MLKGKYFCTTDTAFLFLASLFDRLKGHTVHLPFSRIHTTYSDMVNHLLNERTKLENSFALAFPFIHILEILSRTGKISLVRSLT